MFSCKHVNIKVLITSPIRNNFNITSINIYKNIFMKIEFYCNEDNPSFVCQYNSLRAYSKFLVLPKCSIP